VKAVSTGPGDAPSRSASEWLDAVRTADRRGEMLAAFDLAQRALVEYPDNLRLKHLAVLALARAGSTDEARARYLEYGLGSVDDEDAQALGARIAKDTALQTTGQRRAIDAARAAAAYEAVYDRTGGYYPAVNAATMRLLAGDPIAARRLARRVVDLLAGRAHDSYYAAVSQAEAMLILGRVDDARDAIRVAAGLQADDHSALATTRRQLRLVCDANSTDPDVLSALSGPGVVHYCGHRIGQSAGDEPFPAPREADVRERIRREVRRVAPGYAYGALANGGDILWAEALVDHGARLHVVLPFAADEFVRTSVGATGGWRGRFHRLLDAADNVTYATEDAYLSDDVLFRYASELAMGLAVLHARFLDADVCQLALWDGRPARGGAGTAFDVATWTGQGHRGVVVAPNPARRVPPAAAAAVPVVRDEPAGRVVRALLFGDIRGFSKLTDEQLPRFNEHVMTAFAGVLERHRAAVCFKNTWGDGLFVVLTDAVSAAACAIDLQDAMRGVDLAASRLPTHLALRLSGHLGPVYPIRDPVRDASGFIGSHVSRAARIEPVTPAGAIYVTEPFCAALTLRRSGYVCQYVGHMPMAKNYGPLRAYHLSPAAASASPPPHGMLPSGTSGRAD
jgi:hypothetical protein